ncbi:hypothetical protein D1007_14390 [Hordeum vulgare]|nr:hypothetical protein D1007_14390 [Hordeum vulgare]
MNEERKLLKFNELEELKEVAERKAAVEERREASEEMRTTNESRKVAMEEKKLAIEEAKIEMENEQKLMFMDTSKMDEKQRQYIELCCDQVLPKKQMEHVSTMNAMGGGMGGGLSFMGLMGGGMGMG